MGNFTLAMGKLTDKARFHLFYYCDYKKGEGKTKDTKTICLAARDAVSTSNLTHR